MTPQSLSFTSAGDTCQAWLYLPDGPGPHPVVVLAHGYSVTHVFIYWRVAEAFAAAGFAVLDFDYRNLGGSGGSRRQAIDLKAQAEDLRSAIAFARTLDAIDPDRVVLYGTSAGGGLAIEAAADDPKVAALIAVVPHVDGRTNAPTATLGFRLRLGGRILSDRIGRVLGRAPRRMPAFGVPGSDALITQDDAMIAIEEEKMPGGTWTEPGARYVAGDSEYVNAVTAWEVGQLFTWRPGRRLQEVAAPSLVVIGSKDTLSPPGPQRRAATAAGAEVFERPYGHFDPFRKAVGFDETMAAQLEFLDRALTASRRGA